MAVEYDPNILQTLADVLYGKARSVVVITALKCGVLTFVAVWMAVSLGAPLFRGRVSVSDVNTVAAIVGFLGLLAGADVGNRKAFELRLQAQQVLCSARLN